MGFKDRSSAAPHYRAREAIWRLDKSGRGAGESPQVITGFNTDVKYRGVVYHVQTEDKGEANPLIETLIYKGGEILGSRAGIGYVINYAYGLMMTREYAVLAVIAAAAVLAIDTAGALVEARVKRWAG